MPEASPADAPEGPKPEGDEGLKPDDAAAAEAADEKREPKQYPESYVRSLRAEAGNTRKRLMELEEQLRERDDAEKSEQQKLVEKLTSTEKRAADAETRLIRYEVAAEHGLDMQAAAFLTGSTREEIEHRAEELTKLLEEKLAGSGNKPSTGFDGGVRQPAPTKGTPEEEHNKLLMRALGRPSE
jgi:hypothetical protein